MTCVKACARRLTSGTTSWPFDTCRAPSGQKSFCTSTTIRTSCSSIAMCAMAALVPRTDPIASSSFGRRCHFSKRPATGRRSQAGTGGPVGAYPRDARTWAQVRWIDPAHRQEKCMDPSRNHPRPAIARIWRGRTTPAKADEYHRYLHEHGIKPLAEKALGVQMLLREDRANESEFMTISYWESVEAMARFA